MIIIFDLDYILFDAKKFRAGIAAILNLSLKEFDKKYHVKYFKSKVIVKNEVPFGKFFDLEDKFYDELRDAGLVLCKWCSHISKEVDTDVDNDKWVCPKCNKRGWHSDSLNWDENDNDD